MPEASPPQTEARGNWLYSEISEDEVIFCFAPSWMHASSPEAAAPPSPGSPRPPPPSPTAQEEEVEGWQEVDLPRFGATMRPAEGIDEEDGCDGRDAEIFALTSVT
ncbi:unnamed protein product [Symbiodinium microadriaticum]|nr:unnamed protein product [Symbiodinium microadriaticum]